MRHTGPPSLRRCAALGVGGTWDRAGRGCQKGPQRHTRMLVLPPPHFIAGLICRQAAHPHTVKYLYHAITLTDYRGTRVGDSRAR